MSVLTDVRFAVRTLTKDPSFSVTAIATLAIGIAANTIVFTLLNALWLRPMPVPQANRVVRLYPVDQSGRRQNLFAYADYVDYRQQATGFDTLAAYIPADITIGRSSRDAAFVEPRPAVAYVVSPEYFEVVGMRPALGRLLGPSDEAVGSPPALVISHAMWRGRFAADPTVLGGTIAVNGRPFTVVGVGPDEFSGTEPLVADVWVPISTHPIVEPGPLLLDDRTFSRLLVIGRLSAHVGRASAAETLTVIARRLAASYPGDARPWRVDVVAGTFFTIDAGAKPVIALVVGIVGLVLLIACANVANLTLARAAARQRELAVRLAIGAGRWRIVRQLLTESMLVGLLAGCAALLISEWTLRALYSIGLSLAPFPWTIALNLTPDSRVFAYTFLIAASAGAMFGLVPALQSSSPRISAALHEDGVVLGAKMTRSRIRNGLVITQIACSLVLLIAAALLARGLHRARALDLGFNASNVIYTEYDLEKAGYPVQRATRFTQELRERAAEVPGVMVAGLTSHVPLHGGIRRSGVRIADAPAGGHLEPVMAIYTVVSPEYFDALGIRITSGRNFNGDDESGRISAAIISEGLARRFWPDQPALGKQVILKSLVAPLTVVGVARDTSSAAIWREKEMSIYLPVRRDGDPRNLHLIVRTASEPAGAVAALRQIAAGLDPDLRFEAVPLSTLLRLWMLPSRIAAAGAAILGLLALALASLGIYGVLAYVVSQRTREIGIRMALGADAGNVLRLVMSEGSRLITVGLVLGVAGAAAGAPLLAGLLLDVSVVDPVAFAVASLVLTGVALAACYLPARRAARLEPFVALRTT